jgi:hypothetical protein
LNKVDEQIENNQGITNKYDSTANQSVKPVTPQVERRRREEILANRQLYSGREFNSKNREHTNL